MFNVAISSLIVNNQVLRGRPLGRFHTLEGARAPARAIRVSEVGDKREVWPNRDKRRAFKVKLANGFWVLRRTSTFVTKSCHRSNSENFTETLTVKGVQPIIIRSSHCPCLAGV